MHNCSTCDLNQQPMEKTYFVHQFWKIFASVFGIYTQNSFQKRIFFISHISVMWVSTHIFTKIIQPDLANCHHDAGGFEKYIKQ